MRKADGITKIYFLMKNALLDLFVSFLSLLDLKNGSGSKFYARKWYRDLRKPKMNLFRDKNMNFDVKTYGLIETLIS